MTILKRIGWTTAVLACLLLAGSEPIDRPAAQEGQPQQLPPPPDDDPPNPDAPEHRGRVHHGCSRSGHPQTDHAEDDQVAAWHPCACTPKCDKTKPGKRSVPRSCHARCSTQHCHCKPSPCGET